MLSVLDEIDRARAPWSGGSPYVAYSYAYPHKTAYRPIHPALPLRDVWAHEPHGALFLYLHVPFCEHRCGFCNLFTQAQPAAGLPQRYLEQLRREAQQVRAALPHAAFARCAIGGGTPTFLTVDELAGLFSIATEVMGARPAAIPVSCEASPATVDVAKLAFLRERGVDRISLGVQSFDERDAHLMGRPQQTPQVDRALELIQECRFHTLNIDLIYGGEGQTVGRFLASLEKALQYCPEELYLYPLYVRPLTGLGRGDHTWDDQRLASYRAGRDRLLDAGYEQVSLRMFRRGDAPADGGTAYCCQTDGMVGLGCGARSYTREAHYSTEYAVSRAGVRAILGDYLQREPAQFASVRYGHRLALDDQRRRFVIQSLLQAPGLSRSDFRTRFGGDVLGHLPCLEALAEHGLAMVDESCLRLTPAGLERSDAIGPWLYSDAVRALMRDCEIQ